MKSNIAGKSTSQAEITNISIHGIWLIVHEREHFLSYETYPWFKDAKVGAILNVELMHEKHLHWPELDVDLDVTAIDNIQSYPLVYK